MTIDVDDTTYVGKLKIVILSTSSNIDTDVNYINSVLAWSYYHLGVASHIWYDYNNGYVIKMFSPSVVNIMILAKYILEPPSIKEMVE